MLKLLRDHIKRNSKTEHIIQKVKAVAVRTPYSINCILELTELITDMALTQNIDPSAMLVKLKLLLMSDKMKTRV